VDVIKEDPPDNRILECAAEAESDYIVSGDKDLHRLGRYGQARVITIAEMLALVRDVG
jgi:predicted nucleic acid-binding protein